MHVRTYVRTYVRKPVCVCTHVGIPASVHYVCMYLRMYAMYALHGIEWNVLEHSGTNGMVNVNVHVNVSLNLNVNVMYVIVS